MYSRYDHTNVPPADLSKLLYVNTAIPSYLTSIVCICQGLCTYEIRKFQGFNKVLSQKLAAQCSVSSANCRWRNPGTFSFQEMLAG